MCEKYQKVKPAGNRIRTRDMRFTKAPLYQLSYPGNLIFSYFFSASSLTLCIENIPSDARLCQVHKSRIANTRKKSRVNLSFNRVKIIIALDLKAWYNSRDTGNRPGCLSFSLSVSCLRACPPVLFGTADVSETSEMLAVLRREEGLSVQLPYVLVSRFSGSASHIERSHYFNGNQTLRR